MFGVFNFCQEKREIKKLLEAIDFTFFLTPNETITFCEKDFVKLKLKVKTTEGRVDFNFRLT